MIRGPVPILGLVVALVRFMLAVAEVQLPQVVPLQAVTLCSVRSM